MIKTIRQTLNKFTTTYTAIQLFKKGIIFCSKQLSLYWVIRVRDYLIKYFTFFCKQDKDYIGLVNFSL